MAHTEKSLTMSFELLRVGDAARALGVSPATLSKMRMRGDGPPFIKLGGRLVAYRRADLDAWTASRLRRSTSDNDWGK